MISIENKVINSRILFSRFFVFMFMSIVLLPYILSFVSLFTTCQNAGKHKIMNEKTEIRYAAIGDSYTIGEGAIEPDEAWPTLLTSNL